MQKNEILLSVKNLKTYFPMGKDRMFHAVDGIDITVNRGEICSVIGQSGSGKSVTCMSIMRLLSENAYTEGEITFEDKRLDLYSEKEMRKIRGNGISMIFQNPSSSLNPTMRIGKQLMEAISIHRRVDRAEAMERCREMLLKVGLRDTDRILNAYPFELSGGMCQRVMIAMALLGKPALIIADEPTSSLDVTVQVSVLNLLEKFRREGVSILLITHDLGVVAHMADYVYVMHNAKIVEHGDVYSIFENPIHPYTKRLLACSKRGKTWK